MSLSKEMSIKVNYRRDSFSDRVCDDLCEVILKYLSIEDKLKLECVSKQFQRNIFRSGGYHEEYLWNYSDSERMELLFKKYPNIGFGGHYYLSEFGFQINKQNENPNYFIEKFCQKIISLTLHYREYKPRLFDYFSNVERLHLFLYRPESWFCSQIKLTKLRKLNLCVIRLKVASFAPLLDNHKTTLRSFHLVFDPKAIFGSILDIELDTLSPHISDLSQLSYLGIDIDFEIGFNNENIKEMVSHLSRLEILKLNNIVKRFHPRVI